VDTYTQATPFGTGQTAMKGAVTARLTERNGSLAVLPAGFLETRLASSPMLVSHVGLSLNSLSYPKMTCGMVDYS